MSDRDEHDALFAERLMGMAEADVLKAERSPDRGVQTSVALWMAEELRRQADHLHLPPDKARELRNRSRELRDRVLAGRGRA